MKKYLEEIRKRNLFVSNNLRELKGKKTFLRIDTNSAVVDGELDLDSYKLFAHSKTLKKYVDNGAVPIIVTHQGRKGDEDFVANLKPIAEKMEEISGVNVKYVNAVMGDEVSNAIKHLNPGEALMIKNVRDTPDETCTECLSEMVNLPLTKFFRKEVEISINDGLSVCHRNQTSVVALSQILPYYYGFLVESELEALEDVIKDLVDGKNVTFFIGGKKFEKLNYLEKILEYPGAKFATGGLIGQYIAFAAGIKFNQENKDLLTKEEIVIAKGLLEKFKDKISYPIDYTLDNGNVVDREKLQFSKGVVMDIGPETLDLYAKAINGRCVFAGVMGVFEKGFTKTLDLLRLASGPKTVDLGGHSSAALFQDHGIFEYFTKKGGKVLTAGGAALSLLAGDDLPGLEVRL